VDFMITQGGPADVDVLEPLWKALVEHHREIAGGEVAVRPAQEAWQRRRRQYESWLEEGTGLLFLARSEDSGGAVGYVMCHLLGSGSTYDFGEVRGDVETLAVAPEARGAGVGTGLLDAVRDELRRRGCSHWSISVAAANTGAIRLYERVGFRPWVQLLQAPLDG
jgi:ribosomal protein S18 acetylase RimI-like enzyme